MTILLFVPHCPATWSRKPPPPSIKGSKFVDFPSGPLTPHPLPPALSSPWCSMRGDHYCPLLIMVVLTALFSPVHLLKTFYYCKIHNTETLPLVTFSMLTVLCNHYHPLVPEHFHHPRRKPCTLALSSWPLATSSLLTAFLMLILIQAKQDT